MYLELRSIANIHKFIQLVFIRIFYQCKELIKKIRLKKDWRNIFESDTNCEISGNLDEIHGSLKEISENNKRN